MNKFFRRLPPRLQSLWLDFGPAWPVFLLGAAILGLMIFVVTDRTINRGLSPGLITGFQDLSGDDGFLGQFSIKLQTGQVVQITSRNPALAARLGQSTCIARNERKSGRVTFSFAFETQC